MLPVTIPCTRTHILVASRLFIFQFHDVLGLLDLSCVIGSVRLAQGVETFGCESKPDRRVNQQIIIESVTAVVSIQRVHQRDPTIRCDKD